MEKNPAPVDMLNISKYTMIYRVSCMSGGTGFLPSTISQIDPDYFLKHEWSHHSNSRCFTLGLIGGPFLNGLFQWAIKFWGFPAIDIGDGIQVA